MVLTWALIRSKQSSFMFHISCSMALDEQGGLYTFGSGANGALGHGDMIGQ